MGFIELFFKGKEEIKPKDINLFISQKIEENINLDYKDIRAYHDADDLATHVSSFANSEGGLIILGVSQSKSKDENGKIVKIYPKEITWGEVSLDKESLENKLVSRIKPPTRLFIRPVRNERHKVIFLMDIPKSDSAPHMAPDHRYHGRTNFGTRLLEHYEVANLFRINWTMKEKLVEKIYEPLASILRKHADKLYEYSSPSSYEVAEILSRTYYVEQMPFELREKIDYYISRLKDLDKKAHYALEATTNIASKNVLEYLKKKHHVSKSEPIAFDYVKLITKSNSGSGFNVHLIYKLLLTNQKVQTYTRKEYWRTPPEKISISYFSKNYDVSLDEFDELIWKKCLKEASENTEINGMRESGKALLEEAWDLIDEITRY